MREREEEVLTEEERSRKKNTRKEEEKEGGRSPGATEMSGGSPRRWGKHAPLGKSPDKRLKPT